MFASLLMLLLLAHCSDPISDDPDNNSSDPSSSDIIISEFMVHQEHTLADPDFGEYSGWIELHNRGDRSENISGWLLAGQPPESHPDDQHLIPDGTTIAPGGYLLIWADGRDTSGDAMHTGFTLSGDGGQVGLYGPDGTITVDTITYSSLDIAPDISMGRMNFDGSDHIGFLLPMNQPTPGEANQLAQLNLQEQYTLDIEDPSGLDVDETGDYFWMVSDNPGGSIYKITKTGDIVNVLDVGGEDMEGITQHPNNRLLYVVEERSREIVIFDTSGNEIDRYKVDVEMTNLNDGLEGITINPENDHIFVVNKRLPRALIEMNVTAGARLDQIRYTPMNFGAEEDADGLSLAGLFFDNVDGVLWMVSDEARAVFVLDLDGRPLAAYDAFEKDLESIALIRDDNRIYLASDGNHTLFAFEFPDPFLRLPAR